MKTTDFKIEYPAIISSSMVQDNLVFKLSIDANLDAFNGHFDSAPIVPGVVQIKWVLHFTKTYLERELNNKINIQVERIDTLKFQNVIQPSDTIELTIKNVSLCLSNKRIDFNFSSDKKHSSGKIVIS